MEADGGEEISLSVEETNKLRAKLGLRPLVVGPASGTSSQIVDARAAADKEREAAAVRERIERARREREAREMAERAARGSLGQQLQSEGAGLSAAEWVVASRQAAGAAAKAATSKTTQAAGAKRSTAAGTATDAALPVGLKIRHTEADFAAGGSEVVLTLRDTSLIDAEGNEVTGEEDELINGDIAAKYRSEELAARKRDAKKGVYGAADDDEFGASRGLDEYGNPLPGRVGGGGALLAHYDEKEGLDRMESTLVVGAGGRVVDAAGRAAAVPAGGGAALGRALADAAALQSQRGVAATALRVDASVAHVGAAAAMDGVSAVKFQSDYATPAEERAAIETALIGMGYDPEVARAAAAAQTAPKRQRTTRRRGEDEEEDEESSGAAPLSVPRARRLAGPSLDDDADGAEEAGSSTRRLADQLRRQGGNGVGSSAGDRGSRAARREGGGGGAGVAASDLVADAEAREKSLQAFSRALAAASAKSDELLRPGQAGVPAGAAAASGAAPAAASVAAGGWAAVDGDNVATAALPDLASLKAVVSTASARGRHTHRVYSRLRSEEDEGETQQPQQLQRGAAPQQSSGGGEEEDDDAELGAVLARARRLAAAKAAPPASGTAGAGPASSGVVDVGAARVAAALKVDKAAGEGGPLSPATEAKGSIVFTETTELARLLQSQMAAKQADAVSPPPVVQAAVAAPAPGEEGGAGTKRGAPVDDETTSAAPPAKRRRFDEAPGAVLGVSVTTTSSGGGGASEGGGGSRNWRAVMDDQDEGEDGTTAAREGAGLDVSDDDAGSSEEDEDAEAGRAVRATMGIGAALGMLRQVGALGAGKAATGGDRYAGRTKDERLEAASEGVKLEYRDAMGNLLTPKQAYRELSYKFHGRAPSQKTLDKRMRQMLREQNVATASATDSAVASSMALERLAEAQGSASIVLK